MQIKTENLDKVIQSTYALNSEIKGFQKKLATEVGLSEKTISCALAGRISEVGEATYTKIRSLALTEYDAYPFKQIRIRL